MRIKTESAAWKDYLLLLLLAVALLAHCIWGIGMAKICGLSMASSFDDGEYVFTISVRNCSSLKRGGVITFYPAQDSNLTYIKRIVGLPGETIEAQDSAVLINGKEVSVWPGTGTWGPIEIPDGAVFVMGDSRGTSCDSRNLGCISFAQICTKVIGKNVLLS